MATPNLPAAVVTMLASRAMRTHHARWHYVRDLWLTLTAQEQASYRDMGWEPPRLTGEPGAGLDFLYMHRRMIAQVNALLAQVNDPSYPAVEGWAPIPWDHADPDWPMPPSYEPGVDWSKQQALTDRFEDEVNSKFENEAWLRDVELDVFATEIERGIHNWMHMHWSSAPWYVGAPGQNMDDPRNDYLGSTYSSHVNKAFWKLHGWIDDRIGAWERASARTADFSNGWEGPAHVHDPSHGPVLRMLVVDPEHGPMPEAAPLTAAEVLHAETKFREEVTTLAPA